MEINSQQTIRSFAKMRGHQMEDQTRLQDEFHFLRQKAESYLLAHKKQEAKRSNADLLEIIHELEVHQVELEMQNDELRRTRVFLENSQNDYFNLFEFAPVSFFMVNAKGIITKANIRTTALLNVERHFLINSGFLEFVVPADRGRFYQLQKKVCASGSLKNCEMTMQVKKGKSIPVLLEMLALHHEEKDEPHYLIAAIDISQQKHVEQTLEEIIHERTRDLAEINRLLLKEIECHKHTERILKDSEEKFRTVADYTCDWEFWLGPDRQWLYCSPACERITGYGPADFINNSGLFLSIMHPEERDRMQHQLEVIFLSKKEETGEFRIITKEGQVRWVEQRCQPVYDDNGLFLGRRASNRDITRRKHMEEQLQESEKRFRMALDAASDGLWDRDLLTGEVYYGDNWYKLLGYTKEDVRQGTITWENLLHPDDAEEAKSAVCEYLEGRTGCLRKEFRLRNKRGEWQWILSKGKIVEWDENGRPSRLVGTHTDITVRKNIELELKKEQKKLEGKVRRRTAELEEINTALNVLLRKRTGDREALGAKIAENVSKLIDPYFEKLKASPMSPWQESLMNVLQENIHQLTSPFLQNMGTNLIKFSPMELQVANLVKAGNSSKEIAELLQIASGTVNIHRRNIRKKIGVNNQKANLQVALQAFMKE